MPPVPMNKGLSEGISPYLLVYPADLKLIPEEEISSILVSDEFKSWLIKGKFLIMIS